MRSACQSKFTTGLFILLSQATKAVYCQGHGLKDFTDFKGFHEVFMNNRFRIKKSLSYTKKKSEFPYKTIIDFGHDNPSWKVYDKSYQREEYVL